MLSVIRFHIHEITHDYNNKILSNHPNKTTFDIHALKKDQRKGFNVKNTTRLN